VTTARWGDLSAEVAVRAGGHYVYAAPLADGRGLDWVLLVAVPEAAVVAPLGGELASAALLGLAILVGGVGAAALLAGRIARPLTELAGAARELARGRFATALPPATTEETQALVAAFDAMRAELSRTLADADTARRSAVDADKAKTTFLHGMSHELRTPLTAILGYTDLLLDEAPEGSSTKLDLERIRTSGRHLLALINDVLDLARVESGRISLAIEDVDTGVLAREVADELRPLVERSNRLELEVQPGETVVQADRARLRQVLVNLVGNAAKFTDRGVVRLVVEPRGADGVIIAVKDTGIGFAPELVERLFRPFERAPGVHGREGTGLGLAIVRRLVVALGGELDVRSAPGEGSTFAVHLPRRFPERSETGIPVVRR
jgi:signal transduction histidine kinase